jgi:putative aldouronate transport system permease protein
MSGETRVKKPRGLSWIRRDWRLYVMLILPVAFYLIFCYKPMLGLMIAFQKFNMFKGMWGSKFIGLENFRFVMNMPDFPVALRNTLFLNLMGLIAGFPVPIVLAIMLNELHSVPFKKVSQTLLYLPHFLSWIIIGGMVLHAFGHLPAKGDAVSIENFDFKVLSADKRSIHLLQMTVNPREEE